MGLGLETMGLGLALETMGLGLVTMCLSPECVGLGLGLNINVWVMKH